MLSGFSLDGQFKETQQATNAIRGLHKALLGQAAGVLEK